MAETILLTTLDEYARQLQTHLVALRERHHGLEAAWLRLRDVYEGEGARIFSEAFEAASARLADYANHGAEISRRLQTKIEDLRDFQSAEPGF
jgi:uncharacterized protein YukE